MTRAIGWHEECKAVRGKRHKLASSGTLNPAPAKGQDRLFQSPPFFDPDDALQGKDEMLRRVAKDGRSVTQAAKDFGFSRRHCYARHKQFGAHGFQGFVPQKRGPKGAYKLTDDVVDFLDQARQAHPSCQAAELARRVHKQCGLTVPPRSVARAWARKKKEPLS
jgi:transposase-like protein